LDRLEDERFSLWQKSRVKKNMAKLKQPEASAMHETNTHPIQVGQSLLVT
jgi:hypothetical protein